MLSKVERILMRSILRILSKMERIFVASCLYNCWLKKYLKMQRISKDTSA